MATYLSLFNLFQNWIIFGKHMENSQLLQLYFLFSVKGGFGPEVESSRTFLVSRTHFQALGLGLEASSPRKLPCPRLEDGAIF